MPHTIRLATQEDEIALTDLLPQLAEFIVPNDRNPDHLWHGDLELMKKSLTGDTPNTHTLVAADNNNQAIAIAMYTLKPELLSGALSAHLEALAVHPDHTRQGIAGELITACTDAARDQGAQCMSLHVFANNKNARAFYDTCGFDEELIRCYKPI